jgi:hypothetical protein
MDWVECKSVGVVGPEFADVFVGGEALQRLETPCEVVGCDEIGQMPLKVIVGVVEVAFDRGFFDGSIHPLDLTVGPGMIRLGESMPDAMDAAGSVEGMSAEAGRWPLSVPGQVRELDSVIGEYRVDAI